MSTAATVSATVPRFGGRWGELKLQLRVLRRRRSLDAQLVGGADPVNTIELAARAHQLVERTLRHDHADSVRRVVLAAGWSDSPRGAAAPLQHGEIIANRYALNALAERLRDPAPVHARGMLAVERLLCDGTGPLYAPRAPGDIRLAEAVALVFELLDLR